MAIKRGTINIPNVTGNIVITASAIKTSSEPTTIPCTSISLNKSSLSFSSLNSTQTLTATVTPSNTTDTVQWSSSNTSVATVSNGVVTSKGNGSCNITAICGSKIATCSITVSAQSSGSEIPCTKVTVYPTKYTFDEIQGYEIPVVTCTPSNTTDINTWSTSDPSVATVTSSGVIYPKGNGTCTITVTCGSQFATIAVTVNDVNVGVTLTDFNLDKSLTITSKDDYEVEIIPEPTSLKGYGSARWTISDPSILGMYYYEGTGKITDIPTTQRLYPGKNGTAQVTIAYDLGDKGSMTKTFNITVAIPDNTENTTILYDNPTITLEGIKAKATQNGQTQYFDLSCEPNTGHVSYNSNMTLKDDEGYTYYLALTNKGTSPFGKNGLHLNSGGWYSKGSDVWTEYPIQHSILYFNDFNMNIPLTNVNNSVPSELLNKAIEVFNQTLPNLNVYLTSDAKNTIELVEVDDTWLGGNSMYESTKHFENQLNLTQLLKSYGEYDASKVSRHKWLGTTVHEFGHTLGIKDNAAHYPALMTYNRERELTFYLQPNDIAWAEYIHEEYYGINLITTQEEYEAQVANLDIKALSYLSFGNQYNFEYGEFNENNADLIVECQLEYVETKEIDISRTDKEILYEYRIYNIINENIIKGEMNNPQVKIHISQLVDLDTSKRYKLYLNTYDNIPCSLLDTCHGIEVI